MKLAVLLLAGLLISCGTERQEVQNTVEQEVWEIGPMDVETWAGNVRVHKTGIVRKMSRYRTTNETKEVTFPEGREIGGALLGGLGGPLAGGGAVGLIAAFLMKRIQAKNDAEKAEMEAETAKAKRMRDEVIAGIEEAKAKLQAIKDEQGKPAWDHLTNDLERKQSRDTVEAVKARTA